MRSFAHFDAFNIDEACKILDEYKGTARINAGGTDLLSILKGDILFDYPKAIINIKTITALSILRKTEAILGSELLHALPT